MFSIARFTPPFSLDLRHFDRRWCLAPSFFLPACDRVGPTSLPGLRLSRKSPSTRRAPSGRVRTGLRSAAHSSMPGRDPPTDRRPFIGPLARPGLSRNLEHVAPIAPISSRAPCPPRRDSVSLSFSLESARYWTRESGCRFIFQRSHSGVLQFVEWSEKLGVT